MKISLSYVKECFFALLTLGIGTLLATSLLIDKARKSGYISKNVNKRYEDVISALDGVVYCDFIQSIADIPEIIK